MSNIAQVIMIHMATIYADIRRKIVDEEEADDALYVENDSPVCSNKFKSRQCSRSPTTPNSNLQKRQRMREVV